MLLCWGRSCLLGSSAGSFCFRQDGLFQNEIKSKAALAILAVDASFNVELKKIFVNGDCESDGFLILASQNCVKILVDQTASFLFSLISEVESNLWSII